MTKMLRNFAVRFACASDFVLEGDGPIYLEDVPGPFGPVRLALGTSRFASGEISLPLVVEAEGPNIDEETAVQSFADLARIFPRILAVAANAAGFDLCLESEVIVKNTQRKRRILNSELASTVVRYVYDSCGRTWLLRAIQEYELALRYQSRAQGTMQLAYLYRAAVALSHCVARRLCRQYRCNLSKLHHNLHVAPDEVEGYIYRRVIFRNEAELFQVAYDAHARLFCLQHPEEAQLWGHPAIAEHQYIPLAKAVRENLLQLADISESALISLTSRPYMHPLVLEALA